MSWIGIACNPENFKILHYIRTSLTKFSESKSVLVHVKLIVLQLALAKLTLVEEHRTEIAEVPISLLAEFSFFDAK